MKFFKEIDEFRQNLVISYQHVDTSYIWHMRKTFHFLDNANHLISINNVEWKKIKQNHAYDEHIVSPHLSTLYNKNYNYLKIIRKLNFAYELLVQPRFHF